MKKSIINLGVFLCVSVPFSSTHASPTYFTFEGSINGVYNTAEVNIGDRVWYSIFIDPELQAYSVNNGFRPLTSSIGITGIGSESQTIYAGTGFVDGSVLLDYINPRQIQHNYYSYSANYYNGNLAFQYQYVLASLGWGATIGIVDNQSRQFSEWDVGQQFSGFIRYESSNYDIDYKYAGSDLKLIYKGNVPLNAVPEASTFILVAFGIVALFANSARRWHGKFRNSA